MQITISFEKDNESIQIDVSDELSLNDLKAFIEAETNIPTEIQTLIYGDRVLIDGESTISQIGTTESGVILLQEDFGNKNISVHSNDGPITSNAQSSDHLRSKDPQRNPSSSEPFDHNKLDTANFLKELGDHSNDPESQAKILELIRQKQIEENLQLAFDISPESFVAVNLLYIKLRINGHETYALVDTGAQNTVLHPALAKKFGILNLIDTRFASMTLGVGSQKSEGRIHSVPVSLGDLNIELPCSFTILDIHVGILFGLDMLRRHKCSVDLERDALVIGEKEVKFLTDYEIEKFVLPSHAEIKSSQKSQEVGPSSSIKTEQSSVKPIKDDVRDKSGLDNVISKLFPEESILKITSLGFTEKEAIEALKLANGNVELAASSLF